MKKVLLTLAFISLFTIACKDKHDHHDYGTQVHKDENEEATSLESLTYTLYTEKTELFVEFKPLIVGETSTFAAHFTILGETFKPLTEGSVTVNLIVNDKGIRTTAKEPSTPGIYRLALQPTTAGKGTLVFDIITKDYKDQIKIPNVIIYSDKNAGTKSFRTRPSRRNQLYKRTSLESRFCK